MYMYIKSDYLTLFRNPSSDQSLISNLKTNTLSSKQTKRLRKIVLSYIVLMYYQILCTDIRKNCMDISTENRHFELFGTEMVEH